MVLGMGWAGLANQHGDPFTHGAEGGFIGKIVAKKDGKITTTSRRVISKDGKTLTVTRTGKNRQGQEIQIVQVFEKQ